MKCFIPIFLFSVLGTSAFPCTASATKAVMEGVWASNNAVLVDTNTPRIISYGNIISTGPNNQLDTTNGVNNTGVSITAQPGPIGAILGTNSSLLGTPGLWINMYGGTVMTGPGLSFPVSTAYGSVTRGIVSSSGTGSEFFTTSDTNNSSVIITAQADVGAGSIYGSDGPGNLTRPLLLNEYGANVGIGITSPNLPRTLLDLKIPTSNADMFLGAGGSGLAGYNIFSVNGSSNIATIGGMWGGAAGDPNIYLTGGSTSLQFWANGSPTGAILGNGNWGVGTLAPATKMQVNGTILSTGTFSSFQVAYGSPGGGGVIVTGGTGAYGAIYGTSAGGGGTGDLAVNQYGGSTRLGTSTGTQVYRCSGGTGSVAGQIYYGNGSAAALVCTAATGTLVATGVYLP